MDIKGAQVMFVCIHICLYVFENISQLKPLSEVKIVPKESFVLNTLLTRGILMVRFLTNAWRVILGPIG